MMCLDITLFGVSVTTNDLSLNLSFHWSMQHGEVLTFVTPSLVISSNAFLRETSLINYLVT